MTLVEIKFLPWASRASLNIEVGDEIEPRFRLKAALEIEVGKARKEGGRADLRGAVLSGAVLSGADLRGADLSRADLHDADLSGAVLSGADLSGADLHDADLSGAVLSGAVLRRADLRDADLSGVPKIENIDATILAAIEKAAVAGGGLDMGAWHTCETTHCRAGWAVVLAGPGGAALEFALGSAAAGALIYAASDPDRPIPNFYAGNSEAMRDMRQRAGFEAEAV